MTVVVTQAKRLDEIVNAHYGDLTHLDDVIAVNQHLMTKIILEAGDEVSLPEYESKSKENSVATLWD